MKKLISILVVVLSSIILTACIFANGAENIAAQPTSTPAPALAIPPSPGNIRLGMCDYGELAKANPEFIATRFDYLVEGDANVDIAALKAYNENLTVLAYWDVIYQIGEGDRDDLSEDMFMHDQGTGQRLRSFTLGQYVYLMDAGSRSWREYSLNAIREYLQRGFDGIHLDDVFSDLAHPTRIPIEQADGTPYEGAPAWYDVAQFQAETQGLIQFIAGGVAPKLTVYNGLNDLPEMAERDYLPAAGGAVQEGFVYNHLWGGYYVDEATWQLLIKEMIAFPDDKTFSIVSYGAIEDTQARLFTLASYLLGAGKNTTFYYAPDCATLAYLPEWTLDLGAPVDDFKSLADYHDPAQQAYAREFANGRIYVNPADAPTPLIPLDSAYYRVDVSGGNVPEIGGDGELRLSPIDAIQLQPRQGIILLNATAIGAGKD